MSHYKEETKIRNLFSRFLYFNFPNKDDSLKQIIIKIFFIISLIALIFSAAYLSNYFHAANKQEKIIDNSRKIWHQTETDDNNSVSTPAVDPKAQLLAENDEFKGWITISNTAVDNPIYQASDNDFYLTHNQKKQKSANGALFFDYNNVISAEKTDSNLVIYGHNMKNGSMFGTLKKFKSLDFYKQNPTIEFSTLYKTSTYKIYAIIVLNATKADDNNHIYNISRHDFSGEKDFKAWSDESYHRSIINTNVDVQLNDNIITLVTCVDDFENARLVIMARETREDEISEVNTSRAIVNSSPRYPKRWYDERGLDFPFY